jgi:CubicO group peptidase (beta-lactamase class C family)
MSTQTFLPRTRILAVAFAALALVTLSSNMEMFNGQAVASEQATPRALDRLSTPQDHIQAFDREIRAFAKLLDLPGVVVVVARDGVIVHQVELGYGDIDSKTRVNVNHLFWLASVTKTFTATLIMQMVDEGLVSLDDRMVDYWYPSFFPIRITPDYRLHLRCVRKGRWLVTEGTADPKDSHAAQNGINHARDRRSALQALAPQAGDTLPV